MSEMKILTICSETTLYFFNDDFSHNQEVSVQQMALLFKILIEQFMLHKPVQRRLPKKYNQGQRPISVEKPKLNHIQKNRQTTSKKHLTEKNINQTNVPKLPRVQPNKSIPQKVEQLEKAIEKLSLGSTQPEMQRMLLQEIKGIKSQLREIKQQIGLTSSPPRQNINYQQEAPQQDEPQEENIANLAPRQYQEIRTVQPEPKRQRLQMKNNSNLGPNQMNYHLNQKKQLLDIGKIQPYMKQFKLQATKILQPIYTGYHKRSSKPIVIKYCSENQSMQPQINLYEKLWKNMVKAKKVCINKIYDLNEPLAHYILAIQMNKCELKDIELDKSIILKDVLRGLQFMHDCGYIYRDLHPEHVMQNFEGNIVFVGLKRMKKFMDIKGRILQVRGNAAEQGLHQFVSNARLRGMPEGRKDDLQTVGYLALYLLEGKLPWSLQNMIQVRSKVTLQQLYGKYKGLFEYMVTVHKMGNDEQPNYDLLHNLIAL